MADTRSAFTCRPAGPTGHDDPGRAEAEAEVDAVTAAPAAADAAAAPTLLIVGGHGAVGGRLAVELLQTTPARLVIAGRDLRRAAAFRDALAPTLAARVDLLDWAGAAAAQRAAAVQAARLVVNCVESQSLAVAALCRTRQRIGIDIGASADVQARIAAEWSGPPQGQGGLLLSVGVAPGLSNLLVREAVAGLGPLARADITVRLGAAEVHGREAVDWTLSRLGRPFRWVHPAARSAAMAEEAAGPAGAGGPPVPCARRSFGQARRVSLAGAARDGRGDARRLAWSFDFSDQHLLPSTQPVRQVATWLCFDDRAVTGAFAALAAVRVDHWLPRRWLAAALDVGARLLPPGDDAVLVQVEAEAEDGRRGRWALRGGPESVTTAAVTAAVVRLALARTPPPGVQHLDQWLTLDEVLAASHLPLTRLG